MDSDTKLVGNMALLPIRSQFKGPAPRESKFISESPFAYCLKSFHGLSQTRPSKSEERSCGLEMDCFVDDVFRC